jgi:hypothetical protein
MVLFDEVVQILILPDLDRRLPVDVDDKQGGQIGAASIHCDSLRSPFWSMAISK